MRGKEIIIDEVIGSLKKIHRMKAEKQIPPIKAIPFRTPPTCKVTCPTIIPPKAPQIIGTSTHPEKAARSSEAPC